MIDSATRAQITIPAKLDGKLRSLARKTVLHEAVCDACRRLGFDVPPELNPIELSEFLRGFPDFARVRFALHLSAARSLLVGLGAPPMMKGETNG